MAPLSQKNAGYLLALLATIGWSGNFVIARGIASDLSPVEMAFWRWFIAAVALLPFTIKDIIKHWSDLKGHWLLVLIMSILGISTFNTMIYQAGHTTNATNMSLLAAASPIFMTLLARFFLKETVSRIQVIGLAGAVFGVLVLISRGSVETLKNLSFSVGDLWMLGAVFLFALYSMQTRYRPKAFPQAAFFALLVTLGTVFLLPGMAIQAAVTGLTVPNALSVFSLLYIGLISSVFSFILWNMAIERVGVVGAGVIYYSIPFFVVIEAVILLGEGLTVAQVVGGALILGGIIFSSFGGSFLTRKK